MRNYKPWDQLSKNIWPTRANFFEIWTKLNLKLIALRNRSSILKHKWKIKQKINKSIKLDWRRPRRIWVSSMATSKMWTSRSNNFMMIFKKSKPLHSKDSAKWSKPRIYKNMSSRSMDKQIHKPQFLIKSASLNRRFKNMKMTSTSLIRIQVNNKWINWSSRCNRSKKTWRTSWTHPKKLLLSPTHSEIWLSRPALSRNGKKSWKSWSSSSRNSKKRERRKWLVHQKREMNWWDSVKDKMDCWEIKSWTKCSWGIFKIKSSKRLRKHSSILSYSLKKWGWMKKQWMKFKRR